MQIRRGRDHSVNAINVEFSNASCSFIFMLGLSPFGCLSIYFSLLERSSPPPYIFRLTSLYPLGDLSELPFPVNLPSYFWWSQFLLHSSRLLSSSFMEHFSVLFWGRRESGETAAAATCTTRFTWLGFIVL